MSELRQFAAIEGVALAALVVVTAAVPLVWLALTAGELEGAAAGFLVTAIVGAPLVVFMGAPVYWALVQRDDGATWPPVLLAGAAPGTILLLMEPREPGFGLVFIGYGAAVASLTHWWCGRLALIRKVT